MNCNRDWGNFFSEEKVPPDPFQKTLIGLLRKPHPESHLLLYAFCVEDFAARAEVEGFADGEVVFP